MKIGIVLYPTFGGSGVVATELGKALAEKGHEIHFITYSMPVRLASFRENIFYHEVRVTSYPLFDYAPYELVLTSKIVDIVKYYKLDLLHVHYAIPHASAAYMAKQILKSQDVHIPYITTLHGTDITLVGKDASYEPVITFAINESDAVTAVSNSLKEDTYKHFKITNTINVIPNFICLSEYNLEPNLRLRERYAPSGQKILCHVSNFRKVKRVGDVVRVFGKVHNKLQAKLILVGDGPERHHIEEMCREMGLCDDVILVGKLKTAKEVLAISDLFILPSESESFGLAALEAMASGVPVISTNTGGLPELIEQGKSGYMSRVGDVEEMGNNAIRLLSDDHLLAEAKKNALARAREFDLIKVLPMYEELYQQVVDTSLIPE